MRSCLLCSIGWRVGDSSSVEIVVSGYWGIFCPICAVTERRKIEQRTSETTWGSYSRV